MTAQEIVTALGNEAARATAGAAKYPLASAHAKGDREPSVNVTERSTKFLVHYQRRHADEQDRVVAELKAREPWPDAATTAGRLGAHSRRAHKTDSSTSGASNEFT
jgi:hypothetical protein